MNPSCSVSIVTALGPTTPALALDWAVALARAGTEVVVVDESNDREVRRALSSGADVLRVLHHFQPLGARGALAQAAALATGELVFLASPSLVAAEGWRSAAIDAFRDPGAGVVEVRAAEDASPLLVGIRRAALESIDGWRLLASVDELDEERLAGGTIPLVSEALQRELERARWRTAALVVRASGTGGLPWWAGERAYDELARVGWVPVRVRRPPRAGINVIGMLDAVCGVGDAARRYLEAIEEAEIPHSTFLWGEHGSPVLAEAPRHGEELVFDTNLIALNANVAPSLIATAGRELLQGHRNVALWFWELEEVTEEMRKIAPLFDEIWTASAFMADAFARASRTPAYVIPLPVRARTGPPPGARRDLGMPEDFCFATLFDFGSLALRKNGLGVVRAFCRAFTPNEGPTLLVKTLNATSDPRAYAELLAESRGRRDVVLLDARLSDEDVTALVGHADCLVSLHRAEGFGLSLAEAMAWGKPVIATGWSGNLEFMTAENAYLVPHRFSRVPEHLGAIYPSGARWAEPDLEAAAAAMREVAASPERAAARGRRAQADIRRSNSTAAAAAALLARLVDRDERAVVATAAGGQR